MFGRWFAAYRAGSGRVRVAWWLLALSVVGEPVSAVLVAVMHGRWDPFEQLMIFFSLAALAYSAFGAINAAEAADSNNGGNTDQ